MHELLTMHKLHGHEMNSDIRRCADMDLAEAYVRDQPLDCIYPPEEALMMGTAFPNLSHPYNGWRKMPVC